jgi:hypothetical protein
MSPDGAGGLHGMLTTALAAFSRPFIAVTGLVTAADLLTRL